MPAPRTKSVPARDRAGAHRVGGLTAMRALAHPTRVRMMHLLRTEPMSASELARRLEIRFGSAQYHLRSLERAGIAHHVGERTHRGGTEVLFEVPHDLWVDEGPDTPVGTRQAMNRAYVGEILRRMDAASAEGIDTHRDVRSTRAMELDPEGVAAATEAMHAFFHRLDELALERPTKDSLTFTAANLLFRIPRSASDRAEGTGP